MTLAPTFRCQCNCIHCYAHGRGVNQGDELTTREVKSVLDQARRLGVLQVAFSGGEPLLREDIVELVRHAHDIGLLTRISTNGLGLDRELVSRLKGAGLEKIIALGRRLGAWSVYVLFPVAAGRLEKASEELLTEGEKARVRALQRPTFVHVEIPTPRALCCLLRKLLIYVSPAGDVTPCPFVRYAMGNVREQSLGDLWRRHCSELSLELRGECPLNTPRSREELIRHTQSVARSRK